MILSPPELTKVEVLGMVGLGEKTFLPVQHLGFDEETAAL